MATNEEIIESVRAMTVMLCTPGYGVTNKEDWSSGALEVSIEVAIRLYNQLREKLSFRLNDFRIEKDRDAAQEENKRLKREIERLITYENNAVKAVRAEATEHAVKCGKAVQRAEAAEAEVAKLRGEYTVLQARLRTSMFRTQELVEATEEVLKQVEPMSSNLTVYVSGVALKRLSDVLDKLKRSVSAICKECGNVFVRQMMPKPGLDHPANPNCADDWVMGPPHCVICPESKKDGPAEELNRLKDELKAVHEAVGVRPGTSAAQKVRVMRFQETKLQAAYSRALAALAWLETQGVWKSIVEDTYGYRDIGRGHNPAYQIWEARQGLIDDLAKLFNNGVPRNVYEAADLARHIYATWTQYLIKIPHWTRIRSARS
jgi:hypothetical protein